MWLTRLESIGYVVCAAFAMLAFTFLVCSGRWSGAGWWVAPGLEPSVLPWRSAGSA